MLYKSTMNRLLLCSGRDNGISVALAFFPDIIWTVPVNGTPLLYTSNDDAVRRALGAPPPCYLYAQAFLALHHMHLPDVVAPSSLQRNTKT